MIRESRNEKKLKASLRAQFALKQRLARIDWEADELMPALNDFLGRAQIPDPPSEKIIDVVVDDNSQNPK